jgi:hypothetical protein
LAIVIYLCNYYGRPPRNSAGFCGGGQGLSWAVEPRKEEEEEEELTVFHCVIFSNLQPFSSSWIQIYPQLPMFFIEVRETKFRTHT